MKLISKTLLYYLLISIPLLAGAGLLSYHLIKSELKDGMDEALLKERSNLEKLLPYIDASKIFYLSPDSLSFVSRVEKAGNSQLFYDTTVYDRIENEQVNYRILKGMFGYKGNNYSFRVAKPTLEEDELQEGLFTSLSIVLALLLLVFFSVGWFLSKKLWKPFYSTLGKLETYDISKDVPVNFEKAGIVEFNRLNETLNQMTGKLHKDYIQQKEFTENASHEMQTPLAIIKSRMELMIQSTKLGEEEMTHLQSIDGAVNRLSSLNKALLLLSKIENNQFGDSRTIKLRGVIAKTFENYEDQAQAKKIQIEKKEMDESEIIMNPVLCDILISNLFQNAIRHNEAGGRVIIEVKDKVLHISNSGKPLGILSVELFQRFKKNEASKDSLGLGLAIVKSITDAYGFRITYSYSDALHHFTLAF